MPASHAKEKTEEAPRPPYWAMAIAFALGFYVLKFAIEWVWQLIAGNPFDFAATARKSVFSAVPFGLVMAWFYRRKR